MGRQSAMVKMATASVVAVLSFTLFGVVSVPTSVSRSTLDLVEAGAVCTTVCENGKGPLCGTYTPPGSCSNPQPFTLVQCPVQGCRNKVRSYALCAADKYTEAIAPTKNAACPKGGQTGVCNEPVNAPNDPCYWYKAYVCTAIDTEQTYPHEHSDGLWADYLVGGCASGDRNLEHDAYQYGKTRCP
jgi:hypothetical protein